MIGKSKEKETLVIFKKLRRQPNAALFFLCGQKTLISFNEKTNNSDKIM